MTGYVILEHSDIGPIKKDSDLGFVGFANSIKEAEKMIRREVILNFNPDSINDHFEEYCDYYLICEIFGEIHPVPSIDVKVKLETV